METASRCAAAAPGERGGRHVRHLSCRGRGQGIHAGHATSAGLDAAAEGGVRAPQGDEEAEAVLRVRRLFTGKVVVLRVWRDYSCGARFCLLVSDMSVREKTYFIGCWKCIPCLFILGRWGSWDLFSCPHDGILRRCGKFGFLLGGGGGTCRSSMPSCCDRREIITGARKRLDGYSWWLCNKSRYFTPPVLAEVA